MATASQPVPMRVRDNQKEANSKAAAKEKVSSVGVNKGSKPWAGKKG